MKGNGNTGPDLDNKKRQPAPAPHPPDDMASTATDDWLPLAEAGPLPMDTGSFLVIAIACAEALAGFHDLHLIHWHINPQTLKLNRQTGQLMLEGEESPAEGHSSSSLYSSVRIRRQDWAYMSPEQTGRINRTVDFRTDLYSLGVSFYQLLTGRLPYQAGNLLEWVHFHIARSPRPPHELLPTIPRMISAIVMKLIEKGAENRYQTARGLKYDLEQCLSAWQKQGQIEDFSPGQADQSDRLRIPGRLYGREPEIRALNRAYYRVSQGRSSLLLVTGYAGIGKTSLVHEIYQPVVRQGGFFIEGKFDQLKRSIPYSAVIAAFRELIRQLLIGSQASLESWKSQLLEALKNNARVIIDVIPEVELIVGKQPEIPLLGPDATRNRFNLVFQSFVKVFARQDHPLVLFLDDLQYADPASLKLLSTLLIDPGNEHLLIIGAYRESEVSEYHPLRTALQEIADAQVAMETLVLQALRNSDINEMIADMLDCSQEESQSLTDLVMSSTLGNPFYANQVLQRIFEERHLYFAPEQNRWLWDAGAIQKMGLSENVVDFLSLRIKELSPDACRLLSYASCIGMRFNLSLLSAISGLAEAGTLARLDEAVHEGLIVHTRDFFDLYQFEEEGGEVAFQFLHDRVQEAAQLAISPEQSRDIHYRLGRILLASSNESSRREQVFEIVDHLNRGQDLLGSEEDRLELAALNVMAGQKAKASTAYNQAAEYLQTGTRLMPSNSWRDHYELNFTIFKELSECEYLAGNHQRAEELFDHILSNARSLVEKAEIYNIRIILYATIGQFVKNNELGIAALKMFGDEFPDIQDSQAIMREFEGEYAFYQQLMKGRNIPDLINLPTLEDPEKQVCTKITMNMLSSAYISNPALLALLGLKSINIALQYGVSPESIYSIAVWGLLLGSHFNNYADGYQFGRLALEFNQRFGFAPTRSNIPFVFGNFINHWRGPMRDNIKYLAEGLEGGLEVGDFVYASYSGTSINRVQLSYGHEALPKVLEDTERTLSFFIKINNQASLQLQELLRRTIHNLMGSTPRWDSFNADGFDEELHLARMRQIHYGTGIGLYYVYKTLSLFTYEFYEEALAAAILARQNISYIANSVQEIDCVFMHALCLCACFPQSDPQRREEYTREIQQGLAMLENWSENCPENFFHKLALLQAEWASVQGKLLEAEEAFETALAAARSNGFIHDQALILERAAHFYRRRRFDLISDTYLRAARSAYEQWGAAGKVRQLDELYPWLLDMEKAAVARELGEQVGRLDAVTVVKASQAISSEIVLPRLLAILMKTVIESAGAQRGFLVMASQGEMTIKAEARLENSGVVVTEQGSTALADTLPESVVNYVRRTREMVILDNASLQNRFAADPYFDVHEARSVLCLPILRQSNLAGLLYLENNLVSGAFTSDRIAVLELLASQAAISLENAGLYQERQAMAEELQELNQRLNSIIEFLPDATIVVDQDNRVMAWNRAIEEMTGVKKEDMLGRSNADYSRAFYDASRAMLLDLINYPDKEAESSYSYVVRSGDALLGEMYLPRVFNGKGAYVMGVAAPLRGPDGQIIGAIESIRDISEPRQALEERDRLRYLLNNIIDSMPSILVGTDREGLVTQWNAEAASQTGISKADALGRPISEVLPMYARHLTMLSRALEEQAVQHEDRVPISRAGEIRYSEIMIYPLVADRVEGAVVRVDDVTEKVRLQEMMIQTEKMMSVGGLAAGMAHEINNPLSGILQARQNILNRLSTDLARNRETAEACGTSMEVIRSYLEARRIFEFLEGIHESGARAASIISNMLSFSRRSDARKSTVSLPALIDRTLELAANDYDLVKGFDFRHIEIVREFSPELGDVVCSATEIEQVVFNLVKNAAQALAEGGTCEERPRITLRAYQEDDMAIIEVEDNGPGMSSEIQRKIFEPFYTTKKAGVGTGLGLSVSFFIITDNHQGQMYVDSSPGKGARFTLRLPLLPRSG